MTEQERLMVPRWEVIADMPFNHFTVGQIVTDINIIEGYRFSKYPHLFRQLSWWEHRKEEEMPWYFKHTSGGDIYKRATIIGGAHNVMVYFPKGEYGPGTIGPIGLMNLLPSNETDYLNYINK
jgi:hypothetical protein